MRTLPMAGRSFRRRWLGWERVAMHRARNAAVAPVAEARANDGLGRSPPKRGAEAVVAGAPARTARLPRPPARPPCAAERAAPRLPCRPLLRPRRPSPSPRRSRHRRLAAVGRRRTGRPPPRVASHDVAPPARVEEARARRSHGGAGAAEPPRAAFVSRSGTRYASLRVVRSRAASVVLLVVTACARRDAQVPRETGPSTQQSSPLPAAAPRLEDTERDASDERFASASFGRPADVAAAVQSCTADTTSIQAPCASIASERGQRWCREECRSRIERAQLEREAEDCATRARTLVSIRCTAPPIGYRFYSERDCLGWCRAILSRDRRH